MVQVVADRLQANLQFGAVNLLLPMLHDAFKSEAARSFDQHHGIGEVLRIFVREHRSCVGVASRSFGEKPPLCADVRPHADDARGSVSLQHFGDLAVELLFGAITFGDVAQYHYTLAPVSNASLVFQRYREG